MLATLTEPVARFEHIHYATINQIYTEILILVPSSPGFLNAEWQSRKDYLLEYLRWAVAQSETSL